MKDSVTEYRENVDTKLIIRQRLFLVIIAVLLYINISNVYTGKIGIALSASTFILSIIFGLFFSRMFKIFYHQRKKKVMYELDTVGIVVLILYGIVELSRTWIFEHWLRGEMLNAFGLIVVSGLLLGRFIATYVRIKIALTEKQ